MTTRIEKSECAKAVVQKFLDHSLTEKACEDLFGKLTNIVYDVLFESVLEILPDEDYDDDMKAFYNDSDDRIWEALTEDEVYLQVEEAYKIHKFISRRWLSNISSNIKYDLSVYEAFLNNCKNNGLLSVVNNKRLRLNKKFMEKLNKIRADKTIDK